MRNKLITKITLAYLVLLAVATPVLWSFLSRSIEGYFIERLEENLKAEASILAGQAPVQAPYAGLDGLARKLKGQTDARVTIIAPDGRVLGDSDEDSSRMENHIGRPEVREAAASGWGRAVRYSHTLKIDMLYVAVPVKTPGGATGYLRLSRPLRQAEEAMAGITRRVWAGAFIVFLAAVAMGFYWSKKITKPINEMVKFTKEAASGNLARRLRARGGDEIGVLAANLNEMAGQLGERMDAINREKATMEAVLAGMAEGVLVTDAAGMVILANRSLRATFGIGREDALGRPFLEVIRNSDLSGIIREAYEKKGLVTGDVELAFPEDLSLLASCVPLIIKGEFGGSVLVLHDITRIKALERVRRDFVANVTHELKTPVAAIRGFAETLLSGALDEKENARRFIGIIEANSQRLARLIDDLMTLSKIELGEIKLKARAVSIANVCSEAAALLEPKIKGKGLTVRLDIDGGLKVLADRDRLFQIILNVLDNAVKYTPEGGHVTISANAPEGRETVELSIADTGPGIPPDMLPRIGERFFRVDAARSRELGGTGLGLAIVKHLMKAQEGTFRIDSLPRRGTVVTLGFKAAT